MKKLLALCVLALVLIPVLSLEARPAATVLQVFPGWHDLITNGGTYSYLDFSITVSNARVKPNSESFDLALSGEVTGTGTGHGRTTYDRYYSGWYTVGDWTVRTASGRVSGTYVVDLDADVVTFYVR